MREENEVRLKCGQRACTKMEVHTARLCGRLVLAAALFHHDGNE